ncbi:Uncharacterised protein [uncultured archaeon]|nr:Uncharacterised protein [uncultured archaeon]
MASVQSLDDVLDVEKLIHIANGDLKETRGHWYTLGFKVDHYYSLDEQLNAIMQLGLSKSSTALDYLRNLNLEEKRENGYYTDGDINWGDPCYDEVYPNAKGYLREVLDSKIRGDSYGCGKYNNSSRMIEAREILSKALSQLEESIK